LRLISAKPDFIEAVEVLDKAKQRLQESRTGQYDIPFLVCNMNSNYVDVADFVGPIKIAGIPGKGRGLVTIAAVSKGLLLLVSEAFVIANAPTNLVLLAVDADRGVRCPASQYLAVMKSVQKLRKNPQLANDSYTMFSGESDQGVAVPEGIIDTARMERIHRFSAFGIDGVSEREAVFGRSGLWIMPSHINHSCIANVQTVCFDNVMMDRAIQDLAKGDELVLRDYSHVDLDERTKHLRFSAFTCECPLCVEERRDRMRPVRMGIYYDFTRNRMESHPSEQEPLVASLQETFLLTSRFRFHLYRPFIGLANNYWKNGDLTRAIHALEKAPLPPISERVKAVMDLARLLHEMGQGKEALVRVRQASVGVQMETGIPPNEVLSIFPDLDSNDCFHTAIERMTNKCG
jgi:hypothetical protein